MSPPAMMRLGLALVAIMPMAVPRALAREGTPNFLIIVTDDQGYADLSAFKHHAEDVHTPNLDRLAARGVLFTDAYTSAPVRSPSRAGWNTGQHQVRWDPKSSFRCGLPENVTHVAEIMNASGYVTARIRKNDYGKGLHRRDVREDPLNHGFDEFLGFTAHGHDFFLLSKDIETRTPDPKGHSAVVGPLMRNKGVKEFKEGYLTEIFTDAAIDFMKRNRKKPFFLTLSYNSVHHLILQSPKRYLDKYGVKEIPNDDPTMGSYEKWFKQYITPGQITSDEMRRYYLANRNWRASPERRSHSLCITHRVTRTLALGSSKGTRTGRTLASKEQVRPGTMATWFRNWTGLSA